MIDIGDDLRLRVGPDVVLPQGTKDGTPTFWVDANRVAEVLTILKTQVEQPFRFLFDLTAIDERTREHREGQPASDTTVLWHLMSLDRNADVRIKTALSGDSPSVPTTTGVFANANWYEREVYDLFGVGFDRHPDLRRILMPPTWVGHPLRKDHHARATEKGPYRLPPEVQDAQEEALQFHPEQFGLKRASEDTDFMFLNVGPHHPGTHGVLRFVLQLDGEEIVEMVPDIGFHHRGAEKMGERQTWHSYIPYTDRIDYFSGVANNLAYLLTVEKLAGITVPPRAQTIRVMMTELFRIISHLVWYGTFMGDLGALSPVFYMFTDRERAFQIVEAVTGGRMHPAWFRIGGVAQDLPNGWERLVRDFLDYLPPRLREYERIGLGSRIVKARAVGVGQYDAAEAIEWGISGAALRATGVSFDLRKARPYSGYENFEFDVPTATHGDCYDRCRVRVDEIGQSLRIVEQCLKNMPSGSYKADHPLAVPPTKERTMQDIETLITHFLAVSWGPVIPPGEAMVPIENSKGMNGYFLVSDGSAMSYRTRIRSPSFPAMQQLPMLAKGHQVPDLLTMLGAMDFILADLDR